MFGKADGYIRIDTMLNKKPFQDGLNGLTAAFKKLGSTLAKVLSVAAITAFTKKCIELGSNLAEIQNVVDVVFGHMADSLNQWAAAAAKSYGLSETIAKKYAGLYGAMAKTSGLAEKEAYDISTSLTGLAGDVASFFNISSDEAWTKLKAVFSGETEVLKDIGVVMTQDALNAFALSQGIGKTVDQMTQAEKVMLRYNFLMDAFSEAQGDFVRTEANWANQTRVLKLAFEQFMATIGQGLINVLKPCLQTLNQLVGQLQVAANAFLDFTRCIMGIEKESGTAAIAKNVAGITDAANESAASVEGITTAAEDAKDALAGFDQINKLPAVETATAASSGTSDADLSPITETESAAEEASSVILDFLKKIQKEVQPTIDAFGRLWDALTRLGGFAWDGLRLFYDHFLIPVAKWTFGEGLPRFVDIIANTLNKVDFAKINAGLGGLFDQMSRAAIFAADSYIDFYDYFLSPLVVWIGNTAVPRIMESVTNGAASIDWTNLQDALINLWDSAEPLAETVGDSLLTLFDEVFVPFGAWVANDAAPAFLDSLSDAIDGIKAAWETAAPVVKEELWDNFLKPIAEFTADLAIDAIEKIGSGIKEIGDSVTETEVRNLITLGKGIGAIVLACKGYAAIQLATVAIKKLVATKILPWIATTFATLGSAVTLSLGTVFAGIGALIAGWSIGTMIYDTWGDEIDAALWPIFDKIVGFWDYVTDGCKDAVRALKESFASLFDSAKSVLSDVADFFSGVWDAIVKAFSGAKDWFKKRFEDAWNAITTAFSGTGKFFGSVWSSATDAFGDVGLWFGNKFSGAWSTVKSAFSGTANFFGGVWDGIKGAFGSVAQWFKEIFTDAWEGVKAVFSTGGQIFKGIAEGIGGVFKGIVNHLIDGINAVVALPFKGINTALAKIKDVSILGMRPFDWVDTIDIPEIPHLAAGTTVPANYGDFLAVLGDNRREPEVVSPYSTIVKACKEAFASTKQDITVTVDFTPLVALLQKISNAVAQNAPTESVTKYSETITWSVDRFSDVLQKTTETISIVIPAVEKIRTTEFTPRYVDMEPPVFATGGQIPANMPVSAQSQSQLKTSADDLIDAILLLISRMGGISDRNAGGGSINVNLQVDRKTLAQVVVDELRLQNRRTNGGGVSIG